MKIGIIIQARTDSDRFPKKVLELIDDKSVLWHVINQCKQTKNQRLTPNKLWLQSRRMMVGEGPGDSNDRYKR